MSLGNTSSFGRIAAGLVPAQYAKAIAFATAAGFSAVVMYYFHNRFWWPPDEGAYAHVAARIVSGEVLNLDVQDIHAGYINFANALWLWLFGLDLVSLRYPLAAMGFVQACIIYRILLPMGLSQAVAGSVAMTSLSVVQFLNPTANWYVLFVFVLIVWALSALPKEARWRLEAIGYLVVTLLLFRQLSGAVVGIGVVAFLLAETPGRRGAGSPWLSRSLVLAMAASFLIYLYAKTEILALIIFGIGPLGALAWAASVTSLTPGELWRLIARLTLGGAAALTPLIVYHIANGSLASWLDDTVWAALHLTTLELVKLPSYANLLWLGLVQVLSPQDAATFINGLFWIVLPILPLVLGVTLVSTLIRSGRGGVAFHPLPFVGVFYAVVSAHFQLPIYLFYSTAIVIAGLLVIVGTRRTWRRHGMAGAVLLISAVGLWYQAAQPLSRGLFGIVAGERVPLVRAEGVPRASVWMTEEDARTYQELIALIDREVPEDAPIFALPFNPELYFLADRRNPTRFFSSGFGIRDERALQATIDIIRQDPPALVFHQPDDKYNSQLSDRLMDFVRSRYEALPPVGLFEIYRYRPSTAGDSGARRRE